MNWSEPAGIITTCTFEEDFTDISHEISPMAVNPIQSCQWRLTEDETCGISFSSLKLLKKHIKESHVTKNVIKCQWAQCTATFNTEAALSCHVSKKHCTGATNDEGLWRCTIPGCNKSFMYKQVRDEHVASHNGTRAYCSVCKQWLNAEGSNFQKHMALHTPKDQQKSCKFAGHGCQKKFPRADNLRRHELRCKFGKKVANRHCHSHGLHAG